MCTTKKKTIKQKIQPNERITFKEKQRNNGALTVTWAVDVIIQYEQYT